MSKYDRIRGIHIHHRNVVFLMMVFRFPMLLFDHVFCFPRTLKFTTCQSSLLWLWAQRSQPKLSWQRTLLAHRETAVGWQNRLSLNPPLLMIVAVRRRNASWHVVILACNYYMAILCYSQGFIYTSANSCCWTWLLLPWTPQLIVGTWPGLRRNWSMRRKPASEEWWKKKKLGLIWQPQSGCSRSGGKEPNRKIRWHSAFKRWTGTRRLGFNWSTL